MVPIRFNLKDIIDLNEDLRQSPKALRAIVSKVMTLGLRKLRMEMRPGIPRGTSGKLAASFGSGIVPQSKLRVNVLSKSVFGFLMNKRVSASAAIAGNVLQKPGATAKKSQNLWIPTSNNRAAGGAAMISPRQFFEMPNTFVTMTPGGKKIAFQRNGDTLLPLFVLQKTVRLTAAPLDIEGKVEGRLPEIVDDIKQTIGEVLAARGAVIRQAGGE